ncbi:MAG: aminoacyl-tRNA hydrolase [Lachnospiraceae bacterium]|nr:aminoacyl-tRNA hydrolase [Lachnospiraceae bacterium]
MYIIAGLGNPGKQYENTRHNIGWQVIDKLADKHGIRVLENKFKGLIGKGMICGEKVILVKPLTYMNLSGECIGEIVNYFKIDETCELVVIADDISLDVGFIRMRKKGSAGGHNGLKSIIAHLGHEEFIRMKMGVGDKPAGYDLADYVLGHFTKEESKVLDESINNATLAIETIISEDIDKAMNLYNTKKVSKKKEKAESNEDTTSTTI